MPDIPVTGFYSAAGTPLEIWQRPPDVTPDPDPKICYYTHFDLSTENLGYTQRYNCWGFTFLPRRYWLSRTAVNTLLLDNCTPIADGLVEVGDIIRYQDGGVTTHTGRVWQTDGAGHATLIRSKWGGTGEYIHIPLDVPDIYGTEMAYFRQIAPLQGDELQTNKIADLWIKDSPTDNGEQGLHAPWWTSPDILVDAFPFDGVPDLNPVFDHSNRIWAIVRNRTNQHVDNVYVRFYWADPSAGLPASSWNLIPSTPLHPNPVGPISIDGYSQVETHYVEWIPTVSPSHQCLLAIAYINDNPQDCNNPNPIVYPFEIPWDNNIAQRNVTVKELENGTNAEFSIFVGNPILQEKKFIGDIHAVLTYSPRLPLLGFGKNITPLKVSLALNKAKFRPLKALEKNWRIKDWYITENLGHRERVITGLTLSKVIFEPKKSHRLNIKIDVPKEILKGSVYYLHIFQTIAGTVTGGYTTAIVVA